MTDRVAELEARVQRMEDREAIHALFMRYRQCLDALREPFGLPGRIFRAGSRTVMNETPISA